MVGPASFLPHPGPRPLPREARGGHNPGMNNPGVPTDETTRATLALIRSFTSGTILCDGTPEPVRFVFDGRTGRVVLALDPVWAGCEEFVLCLPDDSFDTKARLLLVPERLDEHDPALDMYLAYHGRGATGVCLSAAIESAKLGDSTVVDGAALTVANPLMPALGRLCRALNEDRGALRRACGRAAGVSPEDPLAVGIDPFGVDVRARFGTVRLAFGVPVADVDEAEARVRALIGGGGA